MKNAAFLFALAISISLHTNGQQVFDNVSIDMAGGREIINFTLACEVNVRHYRIEASNDSINFEVVATMPSRGNSMLATSHKYDLSGNSYKYYRVGMVKMDASLPYSGYIVSAKEVPGYRQEIDDRHSGKSENALAGVQGCMSR